MNDVLTDAYLKALDAGDAQAAADLLALAGSPEQLAALVKQLGKLHQSAR